MKFADALALVKFALSQTLPEWQKKLLKKHRDELQVHSQGEIFTKVDRLFPNEQPDSKMQRILSYEPITKQSFWKGVNNVIEIFQNSSYTAEASEKTVDYITQHNWDDKNLFSYFLDQWTRMALSEDPNALIVVYPFEYIKKFPAREQIKFIGSEYIRHHTKDLVIFTSVDESETRIDLEDIKICTEPFYDHKVKSVNIREVQEKTYSEKMVTKVTREVLHVFNEEGFYRLEQNKDNPSIYDWTFYPIKNEFIPVVTVGGLQAKHKSIHQSLFQSCIPMGNLALLHHSQHLAVNFIFSFPRMSEAESLCDFPECNFGFVIGPKNKEHPNGQYPCPKCGGSGSVTVQSPFKIYKRKRDPNGDNEHLKIPDVEYYTPDVAILKYSKEEWRDYLEEMEKSLFINQQVNTGDQSSAKSKEVDLKDKYSFLKRIAKVFYDRLRFVVQCYENYLSGSPNQVSINAPFSFAIVTEAEAFEALNNILNSDAPILVKANNIEMYINKFISPSSPIKKAFNVLKIVDKLLYYSQKDIAIFKSNSVVTTEQWVIHAFAYPVLVEMYNDDPTFFAEQPVDKIADKLLTELEPYQKQSDSSLKDEIRRKLETSQTE